MSKADEREYYINKRLKEISYSNEILRKELKKARENKDEDEMYDIKMQMQILSAERSGIILGAGCED